MALNLSQALTAAVMNATRDNFSLGSTNAFGSPRQSRNVRPSTSIDFMGKAKHRKNQRSSFFEGSIKLSVKMR